MSVLAEKLRTSNVSSGQVALYWLCQAGFIFKTSTGQVICIDPYFSNVVERLIGFKRMTTCPIAPQDFEPDLIVCTHEHLDHMDTDAVPVLARGAGTHFAGPVECVKAFKELGVPETRCHLLEEGKSISHGRTRVHAVYADHGELATDALGIVFDFEGIKIYHTGDTAYRPENMKAAVDLKPDVLLPCINGAFGNMDAEEAAQLTKLIAPCVVIPTHFWMFVEQNGNPAEFLRLCSELTPQVKSVLVSPGEEFIFDGTEK